MPADAAVVVIAGPTGRLPAARDRQRCSRYLNKGGHLLLMLDPPDRTDAPPLTNLIALAREWGIEVQDTSIVDQSSIGQLLGRGPAAPVAQAYPGHPITDRFNVITMFPLARSVAPVTGGPRAAQSIVETSQQSWAESDVKALAERRPVSFDEGSADKRGPVSVATAAVGATRPAAGRAGACTGREPRRRRPTRQSAKRVSSSSAIRTSPATTASASRRATPISSSTPSTGWRSRRT